MSGESRAILTYLADMVATFPGVQQVYTGFPKAPGPQVAAIVTAGGRPTGVGKPLGSMMRMRRYRVTFVYAIEGAAEDAELTICDLADILDETITANTTLGGLVGEAETDGSIADDPRYSRWAGVDYREYPMLVITQHRESGKHTI